MTNSISVWKRDKYPAALAAMEGVMTRSTFTYTEVYLAGDATLGIGSDFTCYRWADSLLQKKRRAGLIELLPGRKGWGRVPVQGEGG